MNTRPLGPRSLDARQSIARDREPWLREAIARGEVTRLLLLVPDPHARFAGVELSGPFVADTVLTDGYGVCTYVFTWDVDREALTTVDETLKRYADRFGDLRMRPDLATMTPLTDGAWAVVCDVEWPDGSTVDIAPRTVLRDQLAALEQHGLLPSVGLEHEVVFSDAKGRPLTDRPVDFAVGGTDQLWPVARAVRDALESAGLGVESARAECHPGQYEIVLRHRDALAACDDALLHQLITRDTAAGQGMTASYLAAPEPGQGNSGHVHLSLSTVDAHAPRAVLDSFLAGVLRDARALTLIWAPTWNSYVRLRTGPFSPRVLRWGVDDRTASVRLAGGRQPRLEFRFAGADAQPHLVVAALLAAGRAGIEDQLPPPPEGVAQGELAGTPWEALAAFADRGPALFGAEVAAQQIALMEAELTAGLESVSDWQLRRGRARA